MTRRSQAPGKGLVNEAQAAIAACAGWASRLAARRITNFLEERMQGAAQPSPSSASWRRSRLRPTIRSAPWRSAPGLDQSTLSRNLRGLEAAGLVEIAIAEEDQRRRAVWLTETGARLLQKAIPVWRKAHAALAQRVDPRLALRLGAASEELVGK